MEKNSTKNENDNAHDIPILELSLPERLWLEKVNERNRKAIRFSIKEIWTILHEKLPQGFRPENMDIRLIIDGGEKITVLGVIALEKNFAILEKINKVIFAIKKTILDNPGEQNVDIAIISRQSGLSSLEVNFLIKIVDEFGPFYRSGSYETESNELKYFDIGVDTIIFYRYMDFQGIGELLTLKKFEQFRNPDEHFTNKEKIITASKIDAIVKELAVIKTGQEIIWTDVLAELNELKSHLGLSKRNWRQLLGGKLGEMVIAGVISDTISDRISAFINPIINKFLP